MAHSRTPHNSYGFWEIIFGVNDDLVDLETMGYEKYGSREGSSLDCNGALTTRVNKLPRQLVIRWANNKVQGRGGEGVKV